MPITFKQLINQMVESYIYESSNTVTTFIDYMPDHDRKPSNNEILKYLHTHGGKSIKIKKITHDGPAGGSSEVEFFGEPKDVMKLVNYYYDENYSLNADGYRKYKRDYN